MRADIGLTDAQYALLSGFAYYITVAVSMLAVGFAADRYSLNRVRLIAIGCATAALGALLMVSTKSGKCAYCILWPLLLNSQDMYQ